MSQRRRWVWLSATVEREALKMDPQAVANTLKAYAKLVEAVNAGNDNESTGAW